MATKFNTSCLQHDAFLTSHLEKETYRLDIRDQLGEVDIDAVRQLQKQNVFIYGKVPMTDIDAMAQLTNLGFQLVETAVTLEKDELSKEGPHLENDVRLANPEDEEATVSVAASSFEYSRFHVDPSIDTALANRVKAEWVRNYFLGQRGSDMVLGLVDGAVAGFLQLLIVKDVLVIDLIAVAAGARHRRLATDMINFAQMNCRGECVKYRVGTQLTNLPSLKLYQNMGFRIVNKNHVYHYHSV